MMWWWDGGTWGGWGWIGMVVMILFWVAVVVGVVYLVRAVARRPGAGEGQQGPVGGPGSQAPPPAGQSRPDPLRILEERYAKGEIDREEFLQRKADLTP
jgi:putative membrane protein